MRLENRQSQNNKKIDRWLGIPLVLLMGVIRPLWRSLWRSPCRKRILIIKLSALGDTVVMLPALYLLQESFKASEFTFLGGPSNKNTVTLLPFIKQFVTFNLKNLIALWTQRFDMVIDFDQWVRVTALVSASFKTNLNFGFNSPGQFRHFAYDKTIPFDLKVHIAENFWNLAQTAAAESGVEVSARTYERDKKQVRSEWRSFFAGSETPGTKGLKGAVVIHPGCGEHGIQREWPLASWLLLIRKIKGRSPSTSVVITGSGSYELKMAKELETTGEARSLVGEISYRELLALLAEAKEIYSCNTGVMHLASFLNDHLVALHGPTRVQMWGPLWGGTSISSPIACAPCLTWGHDYGCSDAVCVKIITPDQVFKAGHA